MTDDALNGFEFLARILGWAPNSIHTSPFFNEESQVPNSVLLLKFLQKFAENENSG